MSAKYAGLVGRFHLWKEGAKERWREVRDEEGGVADGIRRRTDQVKEDVIRRINHGDEEYDHLFRKKSRWELTRISAAVMGIEFAYAAETAFVSPTLLKIGVHHEHMTLIWCLSPLVGFFLTPILGSMSDRCGSNLGRRRPFILLLSVGVVLGLILVPNGKLIGKSLGDRYPGEEALARARLEAEVSGRSWEDEWADDDGGGGRGPGGRLYGVGQEDDETALIRRLQEKAARRGNASADGDIDAGLAADLGLPIAESHQSHPWGVFFTVLGTVLLDFDADACQSPSRAYLLDVTVPDDHAVGLSTFTIMAGLGGSMGYVMGAIDWGWLGVLFGGHVRLVFTLVLFIFIGCVCVTLGSFAEIPLSILEASKDKIRAKRRKSSVYSKMEGDASAMKNLDHQASYGSFSKEVDDNAFTPQQQQQQQQHVEGNPFVKQQPSSARQATFDDTDKTFLQVTETSFSQASPIAVKDGENADGASDHMATLGQYLWSIIYMPISLRVLCLTNLFCWMSLVCYSLYFTDFVGEAVFKGDPTARPGTKERKLYDQGVQFGCWGMAMYSFSCSCYSFNIERLVSRFRAKPVYICGQLVYCVGMIFMALTRSKWGVLVFSWAAGVMYSTLFTMPYLLVAHYHEVDPTYTQEGGDKKQPKQSSSPAAGAAPQIRGIGTDVGIVSSMVFLAQFILSLTMGSIIAASGSTVAVIVAASVLSFCGAVTAVFVTYHEL